MLCFIKMGLNFINNTQINTNLDPDNLLNQQWLLPFLVPNCINIFYHENLLKYGGNAYSIPNTYCSIDNGNIGLWRTISHEIGHCLGLIHTHQDCTSSYISGTDCASTDDRVCDTPADPWCFSEISPSCFTNSGCSYTGTCKDAAKQSIWSPPYNNIMSYWGLAGCSLSNFTPGQFERANFFLFTYSRLQNCQSPPDLVLNNINRSSGYFMKSAINTLTTNGTVIISGTSNATLAGGNVILQRDFMQYQQFQDLF
jgi:hypothetical protein